MRSRCSTPSHATFRSLPVPQGLSVFSTANRALTFRAGMLDIKATRSTQGVQTMVLRGKHTVTRACLTAEANLLDEARYRCRSIPSIGALLTEDQLKFE